MSLITFTGEGPSPREVSELYHLDQPPPQFLERYPGEYRYMYQANGLILAHFVLSERHSDLTVRQLAISVEPNIERSGECLLGPPISEESVITGGIAWWRPQSATSIRLLSSAA